MATPAELVLKAEVDLILMAVEDFLGEVLGTPASWAALASISTPRLKKTIEEALERAERRGARGALRPSWRP
jgi:hypothetical protein